MNRARKYPRIIIAGLSGGAGKTTLSLGLIAAWREMGLAIAPFKKGPDYIDSGWLSSAAGRNCYNLDPFLIGKEKILYSFKRHFAGADCAVIEGNRGIYDGMDSFGTYSTAELSKILRCPVILIIDCTKMTRTAASVVKGVQKFDPGVKIKGVVLNRVAGIRHEKVVREAIETYCNAPVLGAIPKSENVFSERHMGLTPFQEHPNTEDAISQAREIVKNCIDLDRVWEIARAASPISLTAEMNEGGDCRKRRLTIGILRDSSFQFYYPENFEELERRGADLLEISALSGREIPDIDALYIGGGFPETNAIALAENIAFRKSLKKRVEKGLPVYAECGGLMYLGRSLILDGKKYPMTGVFPISFRLEKRPQAHGYTIVKVRRKNAYYRTGSLLKGHEFHYSRPDGTLSGSGLAFSFKMERGRGIAGGMDGLCYKNVLATYTHLHAYGSPEWADGIMRAATLYRREKSKNGGQR